MTSEKPVLLGELSQLTKQGRVNFTNIKVRSQPDKYKIAVGGTNSALRAMTAALMTVTLRKCVVSIFTC